MSVGFYRQRQSQGDQKIPVIVEISEMEPVVSGLPICGGFPFFLVSAEDTIDALCIVDAAFLDADTPAETAIDPRAAAGFIGDEDSAEVAESGHRHRGDDGFLIGFESPLR